MRQSSVIVEAFPLPDQAPEAVLEAHRRFTRGVEKLNETRARYKEAILEVEAAKASAQADTVAAVLDGEEVPDHSDAPTLADIERLEDQVADLLEAVDAAGTKLADTIKAHSLEWAQAWDAEQSDLAEQLATHLHAAGEILQRYESCAAAGEWLAHFHDPKRNEYSYLRWQGVTRDPIVSQIGGPAEPPTPVTAILGSITSAPAAMQRRPTPTRMVAGAKHVLGRRCEVCGNDPATHIAPGTPDLVARCEHCKVVDRNNARLRPRSRRKGGLMGGTGPQFTPGPPPLRDQAQR